jgi:hypothetical protein
MQIKISCTLSRSNKCELKAYRNYQNEIANMMRNVRIQYKYEEKIEITQT